jgi:hypothetical protein
MRILTAITFIILTIYISLGLWVNTKDIEVTKTLPTEISTKNYFTYSGVSNVHTQRSIGSGTFEDIAAAAKATGTDFVIVTDYGAHAPASEGNAYYGKTLFIDGGEYSVIDSRILNFGFKDTAHLSSPGRTPLLFNEILSRPERKDDSGLFVLAHPLKKGYEWRGDLPPGLNGIEIFNLRSIWQASWRQQKFDFISAALIYPIHPKWALLKMFMSYSHPEITLWDKALEKNKFYAYAGADADTKIKLPRGRQFNFPSYETFFSIIKNYVVLPSELTGNYQNDRDKILSALNDGQFYIGLNLIGDPKGFSALVFDSQKRAHLIGSTVVRAKELVIELPGKPLVPFEIIVYNNAERILASSSVKTTHKVAKPGTYRIEVRAKVRMPPFDKKEWVTWIVTNPFFIQSI